MPIVWTKNPAANQLLEEEPLALLIGLVLDQQVPMEKAFNGPFELKQRLGHLDVKRIAEMDPDRVDEVFRTRPALHRFPGSMARRVQAMCQTVVAVYGGDPASVWTGAASGDELAQRIGKLPGFGAMKVKILISVLAKKFDVRPPGWEQRAADWHNIADVDSEQTMVEARAVKRQLKAEAKDSG